MNRIEIKARYLDTGMNFIFQGKHYRTSGVISNGLIQAFKRGVPKSKGRLQLSPNSVVLIKS